MNEELLKEIKSTLPWLLAAAILVGGYYVWKNHRAAKANAASEVVVNAYTVDELEDAAVKFKGAKSEGAIKIRLAKGYYDAGRYEESLSVYEDLAKSAPEGFDGVAAVGKAECLEALGKYDEALAAYDGFVSADEKSYLKLTAQLGAARCVALKGDKAMATERLETLKAAVGDEDAVAKARIEAAIDLVKRYEKREAVSLFDAADAAAKQIEKDAAQPAAEAPAAPAKAE